MGLFAATASLFRPVSGETIARFWQGFRRSYLPAAGLGLFNLVIGVIIYVDIQFFWALESWVGKAAAILFGSIGATVVLANVYAWPLLAWYPQPVGRLIKRSFLLAAAHPLPAVGAVAAVGLLLYAALALLPGAMLGLMPAMGPGVVTAIVGALAWRGMKPYAGDEDELDSQP